MKASPAPVESTGLTDSGSARKCPFASTYRDPFSPSVTITAGTPSSTSRRAATSASSGVVAGIPVIISSSVSFGARKSTFRRYSRSSTIAGAGFSRTGTPSLRARSIAE